MTDINPVALFDLLFIGEKIEKKYKNFALIEINILSYLSCLLSLYDGNNISKWGYLFISQDGYLPISDNIISAWEKLIKNQMIIENEGFGKLSTEGKVKINQLSKLDYFNYRKKYLQTACQSSYFINLPEITDALSKDPMVMNNPNKVVLDDKYPSITNLYEQFEVLRNELEVGRYDLITPALTWIKSLQL